MLATLRTLARMIVAARDEGCLKEVLVIAAALTVQDPRERPQERQGTADAKNLSARTLKVGNPTPLSSGNGCFSVSLR